MTAEERKVAGDAARFALGEGSHPVDAAIYAAEKALEERDIAEREAAPIPHLLADPVHPYPS